MDKVPGTLIISLDFELYWGMFDKVSLEEYGNEILGVREAIPAMLALFDEYEIHATWAVVGMMGLRTKDELVSVLPRHKPQYKNVSYSAYRHLESDQVGESESGDPYHFGASLIQEILRHPNQEIGSHTFSHYYCLEEGQTREDFAEDLKVSRQVLNRFDVDPVSLVLPRNQVNQGYMDVLASEGFSVYRGTERHSWFEGRKESEQKLSIRIPRLLNHYVNLSGHHTYKLSDRKGSLNDISASKFLRPYSNALSLFESLRMRRIHKSMLHAAREAEAFHLWWHPHNFGTDLGKNMAFLKGILDYYVTLRDTYGMCSCSMKEAAQLANENHG